MKHIKTYEDFTDKILNILSRKRFFGKNYNIILRKAVYKLAKQVFKDRDDIKVIYYDRNTISGTLSGVYFEMNDKEKESEKIYIDYEIGDENTKYTDIIYLACTTHRHDEQINEFCDTLNEIVSKYAKLKNLSIKWFYIQEKDVPNIVKELNLENYNLLISANKYNL